MKIRAVPDRWVLLVEITVPAGSGPLVWQPAYPISFANGETLESVTVIKPANSRNTPGVFRLYRSIHKYPKYRATQATYFTLKWSERIH